jgi:hypothetical protein
LEGFSEVETVPGRRQVHAVEEVPGQLGRAIAQQGEFANSVENGSHPFTGSHAPDRAGRITHVRPLPTGEGDRAPLRHVMSGVRGAAESVEAKGW